MFDSSGNYGNIIPYINNSWLSMVTLGYNGMHFKICPDSPWALPTILHNAPFRFTSWNVGERHHPFSTDCYGCCTWMKMPLKHKTKNRKAWCDNIHEHTQPGWWFGTFCIFHILGMSSSQLTFILFRGVGTPPTSNSYFAQQGFWDSLESCRRINGINLFWRLKSIFWDQWWSNSPTKTDDDTWYD